VFDISVSHFHAQASGQQLVLRGLKRRQVVRSGNDILNFKRAIRIHEDECLTSRSAGTTRATTRSAGAAAAAASTASSPCTRGAGTHSGEHDLNLAIWTTSATRATSTAGRSTSARAARAAA